MSVEKWTEGISDSQKKKLKMPKKHVKNGITDSERNTIDIIFLFFKPVKLTKKNKDKTQSMKACHYVGILLDR